jgi:predicted nucleotidyltransferase
MIQPITRDLAVPHDEKVCAVMLFGSRARGDSQPESDVDVLLVTDGSYPRNVTRGGLALALYPMAQLLDLASHGDLFVAHLVHEAVALHDPGHLLESLRANFRRPPGNGPEVGHASDLGRLLLDIGPNCADQSLINRRIAWVVRTILIARAAAEQRYAFSAAALTATPQARSFLPLIECKGLAEVPPSAWGELSRFLTELGDGSAQVSSTPEEWAKRFKSTANTFGAKTLREMRELAGDGGYR